jgi:hypothetical protein
MPFIHRLSTIQDAPITFQQLSFSQVRHASLLAKCFKRKSIAFFFFFSVTSNLPWFFQYKFVYDINGNISNYTYTSVFLDKTFHDFWIYWQFVVHTLIPFIILIIINFLILWKLKSSQQSGDEINATNQMDGLRRHTR